MKRFDKPLRFTEHALKRMQQRGISREQVAKAVRRPSTNLDAARKGAKRLEMRLTTRKRLVVIAEEEERFTRIVSAWIK